MCIQKLSRKALDDRRTALVALLAALKAVQATGDYSQVDAYYETLRAIDDVEHKILDRVRTKGETSALKCELLAVKFKRYTLIM